MGEAVNNPKHRQRAFQPVNNLDELAKFFTQFSTNTRWHGDDNRLSGYFIIKSGRSIHPSCIRRFALSVGIRSENMRDTSGFRVSPSTKVTGNLHFTSQSRNMEHVQLFPTPPLSPWKRMTDFEVTVDFLEPVILVYPLVSMTN